METITNDFGKKVQKKSLYTQDSENNVQTSKRNLAYFLFYQYDSNWRTNHAY